MADLRSAIDELWARRTELSAADTDAVAVIHQAIDLLDRGEVRVAEVVDGEVVVHEWLKHAILLLFRTRSP
jgi:2,3,4,5-tetrahydropyridine-2-carboxylate N-succinyltransferase